LFIASVSLSMSIHSSRPASDAGQLTSPVRNSAPSSEDAALAPSAGGRHTLAIMRVITCLLLLGAGLSSAGRFCPCVSVGIGLQHNFPTPLVIRQGGSENIELTARYETRPFEEVPYYDLKAGLSRASWALALELVHHKLYLVNRPAGVDVFEITHGYNPILLNVVHEWRNLAFRAGAGILLSHPETTVRGRRWPETGGVFGWYVSGPAAQAGVERDFGIASRFFLGVEGKLTAAWARVPVCCGSADVPNVALHCLLLAGWRSR